MFIVSILVQQKHYLATMGTTISTLLESCNRAKNPDFECDIVEVRPVPEKVWKLELVRKNEGDGHYFLLQSRNVEK